MFQFVTVLNLGSGHGGLTDLRAQLVDAAGANVGSAVTTGFVELGTATGIYLWNYASFPDGHRGAVKVYSAAAGASAVLAAWGINPEEVGDTEALHILGKHTVTRNMSYAAENLTAYDVRLYDSAANAATDDGATGLLASYSVTNTYDGLGRLSKSVMVRN